MEASAPSPSADEVLEIRRTGLPGLEAVMLREN